MKSQFAKVMFFLLLIRNAPDFFVGEANGNSGVIYPEKMRLSGFVCLLVDPQTQAFLQKSCERSAFPCCFRFRFTIKRVWNSKRRLHDRNLS